jgi:mono/diheme cytochrome c family protein
MRIKTYRVVVILISAILLVACAEPRSFAAAPTSIPTLVPATQPASLPESAVTPAFALLSYPARPPSAALGQPIYQTYCAECHGEDGTGLLPGARNFTDLDYIRGETPASFYATVTEGRGEMPGFRDRLASDERWDAVYYLWRFSTDSETLTTGQTIFNTYCAACHGENGVGTVLGAADFTDLRFMADRAPRDFYLTITQGKGSMPAWQGRLSQEERWAVIDYLMTFSYDPGLPLEAAAAPATQPAVEASCSTTYISPPNPFEWNYGPAIDAGEVIYEQSCNVCHGEDGSGAIPGAPDLTTPVFQEELRSETSDIPCIVAEGQSAMPGWKETLTPEQIWQVLVYINSL